MEAASASVLPNFSEVMDCDISDIPLPPNVGNLRDCDQDTGIENYQDSDAQVELSTISEREEDDQIVEVSAHLDGNENVDEANDDDDPQVLSIDESSPKEECSPSRESDDEQADNMKSESQDLEGDVTAASDISEQQVAVDHCAVDSNRKEEVNDCDHLEIEEITEDEHEHPSETITSEKEETNEGIVEEPSDKETDNAHGEICIDSDERINEVEVEDQSSLAVEDDIEEPPLQEDDEPLPDDSINCKENDVSVDYEMKKDDSSDKDDKDSNADKLDDHIADLDESNPVLVTRNALENDRNFRSAILEDWDPDGGSTPAVNGYADDHANETKDISTCDIETVQGHDGIESNGEQVVSVDEQDILQDEATKSTGNDVKSEAETQPGLIEPFATKAKSIGISSYRLSRNEAIQEIINTEPKSIDTIIPAKTKNLFLAIGLSKKTRGQKKAKEADLRRPKVTLPPAVKVAAEAELLQILEGDQVGDWRKSVPVAVGGKVQDDAGIENEMTVQMAEVKTPAKPKPTQANEREAKRRSLLDPESERRLALQQLETEFAVKAKPKPTPANKREPKRRSLLDPESERRLALQQLETEFAVKVKRPKVPPAVKVAAEDLKRALSSTPLLTGNRKRRPCYLPEEKPEAAQSPSTDAKADVTASAPKIQSVDSKEDAGTVQGTEIPSSNSDKDEKTIIKKKSKVEGDKNPDQGEEKTVSSNSDKDEKPVPKKKTKADIPPVKKGKAKSKLRELQQLLGDEGAVRMIYEAENIDKANDGSARKPQAKTKRDLIQKTKFVKNAVMRLSSGSEKSLRGKRLPPPPPSPDSAPTPEPLFPPATPIETPGRSRKKARPAEASRILYRHSSSESFDDSESLHRSSLDLSTGMGHLSPDRNSTPKAPGPSPVRKSSRPRKVSSRFSVWAAESLSAKKSKKSEDAARLAAEFQILKSEPATTAESESKDLPEPSTPPDVKTEPPAEKAASPEKQMSPNVEPADSQAIEPPVKTVRSKSKPATPTVPKRSPAKGKKLPASKQVSVSEQGPVFTVKLTPTKSSIKNGLTAEVMSDLKQSLDDAAQNDACKVVVLSSDGDVFCQGIDLALIVPGCNVDDLVKSIRELICTLSSFSKPLIAAVHGPAVGLGVSLLPMCDVVVASDRSTFFTPYTRLCQGPEGGASVTFPKIGLPLVSELMYKCCKLTSSDALRLGLVSQVVPTDTFSTELNNVCECICAQSDQALKAMKRLLTESGRKAILEGVERECEALAQSWTSPDCLEATAKFLASGELQLNPMKPLNVKMPGHQ